MLDSIWLIVKNVVTVAFWFNLALLGHILSLGYEWWQSRRQAKEVISASDH